MLRVCLEGHGYLVSRLITHISHIITVIIPIKNPLTKSARLTPYPKKERTDCPPASSPIARELSPLSAGLPGFWSRTCRCPSCCPTIAFDGLDGPAWFGASGDCLFPGLGAISGDLGLDCPPPCAWPCHPLALSLLMPSTELRLGCADGRTIKL